MPRRLGEGRWVQIPRESDAGRFVLHRDAKTVFKNLCDKSFGGGPWFDVLNQMGGCPAEFVDAWNAVIDQRLRVAVKRILHHLSLCFFIRLVYDDSRRCLDARREKM